MKIRLVLDNLSSFFLDPGNQNRTASMQAFAWVSTILLGIFTLGIGHGLSVLWKNLRKVQTNEIQERVSLIYSSELNLQHFTRKRRESETDLADDEAASLKVYSLPTPLSSLNSDQISDSSQEKASQPIQQPESVLGKRFTDTLKVRARKVGNKTANLEILQKILAHEKGVHVPDFLGISHNEVLSHIEKSIPDFSTRWINVVNKLQQGSSKEETIKIINNFQKEIEKAFSSDHLFLVNKEFLQNLKAKNGLLIVRSTGREDSLQLANPGGNTSIAHVALDHKAISKAIGEVISSYFSLKSLQQRKACGDNILEAPFIPVLLQEMVGERESTEENVPTSGVLYTTEGALYTQGVSQISAAFGHAEGVVTGTQASDLFYVQGDFVHGIIQNKPTRIRPTRNTGLETVPNAVHLQQNASLSKQILDRLYRIGQKLENHYGYPLDVEWSYDPSSDTLSIFQARPIPAKKQRGDPSYIAPEKVKEMRFKEQISVICSGSGSVIGIDTTYTLFADTAPEALETYLKTKETDRPALIVLGQSTAINSHEAGFFREQGVVVIHLEKKQWPQIEHWRSENHPVLVDIQVGFVGVLPKESSVEEFCKKGLRYHLAPKEESLLSFQTYSKEDEQDFLTSLAEIAKKYKNDKPSLETGVNKLDRLLTSFEKAESREKRAWLLCKTLRVAHLLTLSRSTDSEKLDLQKKLIYCAQHAWKIYEDPSQTEISKKFAINWLRGALLHKPRRQVLSGESIYGQLEIVKERQKLGLFPKPSDENAAYIDLFLRCQKWILKNELRMNWQKFIQKLNLEQLQKLAYQFKILDTNAIPIWLNRYVEGIPENIEDKNVSSCLDALLRTISTQDKNIISFLQSAKQLVQLWERQSHVFGEPDKLESSIIKFKKDFNQLASEYSYWIKVSQSRFVKTLLAQSLKYLVATCDTCIKNLTSSQNSDLNKKAEQFSEMLEIYLNLTLSMLDPEILGKDSPLVGHAKKLKTDLPTYFISLKQNAKLDPKKAFLPSRDFDVTMAALGSCMKATERVSPKSLEDLFTQLHQSLITAVSVVESQEGLKIAHLPESMQNTIKELMTLQLRSASFTSQNPVLQSIDYQHPVIRVYLNCPLKNHSAQVVVESKLDALGNILSTNIESHFFAPNNRMGYVNRNLTLFGLACYTDHKVGLSSLWEKYARISPAGTMSCNWYIKKAADLKATIDFIQSGIDFLQLDIRPIFSDMDHTFFWKEAPDYFELCINNYKQVDKEKILNDVLKELNSDFSLKKQRYFIKNHSIFRYLKNKQLFNECVMKILKSKEFRVLASNKDLFAMIDLLKCIKNFKIDYSTQKQNLKFFVDLLEKFALSCTGDTTTIIERIDLLREFSGKNLAGILRDAGVPILKEKPKTIQDLQDNTFVLFFNSNKKYELYCLYHDSLMLLFGDLPGSD